MTVRVIEYVTSGTTSLEVARQDYELAERAVSLALLHGCHRIAAQKERFDAAVQRRHEARERWLEALRA